MAAPILAAFLDRPWDQCDFHQLYLRCDKKLTKKLTPHDQAAVNIDEITHRDLMEKQRAFFWDLYGDEIANTFRDLT